MNGIDDLVTKMPVCLEKVPCLTNKGGEIKVLISPKTVNAKKLIMGTALLKPGEVLVEHVHDYGEEAFFVRSGYGLVFIDDLEVKISPETAVIIPQNTRHKLINNGTENLEIIFASAPLAPVAEAGDRIITGK